MKHSDFLKSEQDIYVKSLEIVGTRSKYIEMLSELYRIPLDATQSDENSHPSIFATWWLAKLTLNSMYNAFQNYFRLQNYLCLASLRYGVEATLKAFYLQSKPDTIDGFLANSTQFQRIKSTIGKEIQLEGIDQENIKFLFEAHSQSSSWGSHPDINSITHRRFRFSGDSNDARTHYMYFQIPESEDEFIREYLGYFPVFSRCLQVYKPFIESHTSFDIAAWDRKARQFTTELNKDIAQYLT